MLEQNIKQCQENLSSILNKVPISKALHQAYHIYQMLNVYEKNPKANLQYFKQFEKLFIYLCENRFSKSNKLEMNKFEIKIFNEIRVKYSVGEKKILIIQSQHIPKRHSKFLQQQLIIDLNSQKQNKLTKTDQSTSKSQECDSIYQLQNQIRKAYSQHRIDQAYQLSQQYKQYGNNYIQRCSTQFKELLNTIQYQFIQLEKVNNQFQSDGWTLENEQNGVTLWYKAYPQEKLITIKAQTQIDITVDRFISIVTEIDLIQDFMPFAQDTRQKKVLSRNQKIGHSVCNIPLLTYRQAYFYAAGYDRLDSNGSVILYSRSIDKDKEFQQKYNFFVPQKTKKIRMGYKFYALEYKPVSLTRGKIRLISNVDFNLRFLPMFILRKSAAYFSVNYFKNVQKINKKFKGTKWQKKIEENPELYQFFRRRIREYFDS